MKKDATRERVASFIIEILCNLKIRISNGDLH